MTSASITLSLYRHRLEPNESCSHTDNLSAIWVASGEVLIDGKTLSAGQGECCHKPPGELRAGRAGGKWLRFEITRSRQDIGIGDKPGLILKHEIVLAAGPAVFRLDEVAFPPNAIAFKHVHPGPGIRYLVRGRLEIESDEHVHTMRQGEAWYEAADSPVKAKAGDEATAFVRALILPVEFEGKPTLKLLNPEDEHKPRAQQNRRFFDHVFAL